MKGWSLSRKREMGSLDEWEFEPLLILLSSVLAEAHEVKEAASWRGHDVR
jgi:hypothetical protein